MIRIKSMSMNPGFVSNVEIRISNFSFRYIALSISTRLT
jgi:hypothetical protein